MISMIKSIVLTVSLWLAISGALLVFVYFSGLVPSYVKDFGERVYGAVFTSDLSEVPSGPMNILIPKIGVASPIIFPESADLETLKAVLRQGVAHYPESALPGQKGNVFIFGHSSNRVFEKNPAMTAFTNLNKLEPGDEILINTSKVSYRYKVISVEIVKPEETRVYLESDASKLTLSTCWPVGDPSNRFVVEAEFLEKSRVN